MTYRSARILRGSLLATLTAGVFALGGAAALAQSPPAKPGAKPAAKPAAPAPAPAAQTPAAPPAQAPGAGELQLVFSPWTKICSTPGQNGQDPNTPKVCATVRDARTETGIPVLAVALIEPEGAPKKILRVTLPAPVILQYGSRIIVDSNEPATSPFFTCMANNCMADYEGTPDLITKMKKGTTLSLQAINLNNSQIAFAVPLADFGKTNEGPPIDPEKLKEQQAKLDAELQKKAEDLRKKMEQQQQGQAPAAK